MYKFFVGRLGDGTIPEDLGAAMFRLRHQVICERLGWRPACADGLEIDEYDDGKTVYFILQNLRTREVEASWRMRPTDGPYMLRDSFRELLDDQTVPNDRQTWEVSRFVVADSAFSTRRFQLGEASQDLFAQTILRAADYGVRSFIWVTTVSVERLGRRLGYRPQRLGPPMIVGNVLCIAEQIEVDHHSLAIAMQRVQPLEVAA